ncbi:Eco57I restriction-modification methylase domain-containing protein [Neorhizobium sp. LjRoot104]|uniref:Eco57I restriction-modification methylase domain-containing protein n=1 Tax=Neorhizobium sp. LjRoot104 TaxID=3342254 RepID=UPI003ECF0D1E
MNFMENESAQKLRGGYYTPSDLAAFIARWVKEISPKRVLEPSCGDGAFLGALAAVEGFEKAKITAFELDEDEARKAKARASDIGIKAEIHAEDFLGWAIEHRKNARDKFDAVIGNPPFVRYQYLPEIFQHRSEQIFGELELPFTKHTNAWVPFILASMSMLRAGGRLAMVVPAEIIHVTHAQSLRSYLGRECRRLVIIDPEELWFADTLQGAVILLAEKRANEAERAEGLGIYAVKGREFIDFDPTSVFEAPKAINGKTVQGKWTRALLGVETRSLFDQLGELDEVYRFKDIAKVDVGIVTGANKFFLVPDETVKDYKLGKWAHPMFGRSEHCPGVIYDERQHRANSAKGNPTNFLWFNDQEEALHATARTYIAKGEAENLHTRYKCRIRKPWYTVPSVYSTEIGMLKRSHDTPRLILNTIGAYTTDTAYRIRTSKVVAEKLVGSFINPLTALSAELEGRHYGGGVLELIPSEIEKLLIPLSDSAEIDLQDLDKSIRTYSTHRVLERQGRIILGALGLSRDDQHRVLEGWRSLRDRRHRTSSEPLAEEA